MARKTSLERWKRYRDFSQGVKKRWLEREPLVFAGKTYTPQQIVYELQSLLDEFEATRRAHVAWRAQVALQREHERRMRTFVRAIELKVRSERGHDAAYLGEFGLEREKKPGPKTAEVKARSAEKAQATRARHAAAGKHTRRKRRGR
jgi:hypothetical protein